MDTVYKLTRPNLTTYAGFRWEVGIERTFSGMGELCGPGFAHAYLSPGLAVLLNPIHARYNLARLFRAEGLIAKRDHGLKVGCIRLTLIEEMTPPCYTATQRIYFAILCARAVCHDEQFAQWADQWIRGVNRTEAAAKTVAARAADVAAGQAATWTAAREAEATVRRAWAAACARAAAAEAARHGTAWGAWAAMWAAGAVGRGEEWAACAAMWAAGQAAESKSLCPLQQFADEALMFEAQSGEGHHETRPSQ